MKIASQKIFRMFLILISLLGIFYFVSAKADNQGGERILSFVSDIHINPDASADVTETIKVVALQQQIKHGIFRILLTSFRDSAGKTHKLSYQIHQVYQNSITAPFHLGYELGGIAIYVGSKNRLLEPGTYTYVLQYHVTDVVTFLADEDEFYWNVTGSQWGFPIEEVQANVYLPEETTITHYTAYTGATGEKGQDFTSSTSDSNAVSYTTTRTLNPKEGLTLALAWPKGIIHSSANGQHQGLQAVLIEKSQENFVKNRANFISLQILFLLLFYYGFVWYWEAREPPEGTIIPLFEPPQGLSPAGMRYISEMGFDFKTFSTAIVSLAAAGILTIQEDGGEFTLIRKSDDFSKVSNAEKTLAQSLFRDKNYLVLNQDNYLTVNSGKGALKKALGKEFENVYFVTHAYYLVPGFILGVLALAATLRSSGIDLDNLYSSVLLIGMYSWFLYRRVTQSMSSLTQASSRPSFLTIVGAIANVVVLLLIAGLGLLLTFAYSSVIPPASLFLLVSILIINLVFYHVLKVHTPQGRRLMDKVEGFKMFLSTTEQDRLERLNPPEKTPELFEKYLPYALALSVENSWGTQFTQILQKASIGVQPYHPVWYVGHGWSTNNPAAFSSYLNTSLASALESSSLPASSGGGFSGGGGGGGGGGGW